MGRFEPEDIGDRLVEVWSSVSRKSRESVRDLRSLDWRGQVVPPTHGDIIAGLSVGLAVIPQSLAYARLAGMPPVNGLFAAAVAPLAAAYFASSPYLQPGPTAITAILTAGVLTPLALHTSSEYVLLASLLALLVGVIRVLIGLLNAGKVAYLMSDPLLRGFTTGAAILVISSQLPGALGVENPVTGGIADGLWALAAPSKWNREAMLLAAATAALSLGARRLNPLIPGPLLAMVGGIVYSMLRNYDGPTVRAIPHALPTLNVALPWHSVTALVLPAGVIALIGFSEAASIARLFAARQRQHWDPDRDFISQGAANISSALVAGFPVGASFSRSTLAFALGARTRWSGAITGITVLLALPFTGWLAPLPAAVLSGMVIAAVVGLIHFRPITSLFPLSKAQFIVAAGTLFFTLSLAPRIEQAVVLGVMLAIGVHLWREFRVEVESWVEGDELHLRPRGVLWFGSAEVLKTRILDLLSRYPSTKRLVFHLGRLGRVDLTGAMVLETLITDAREAGVESELINVHPRTAKALRRVLASMERPPRVVATSPGDRGDIAHRERPVHRKDPRNGDD